jgi:hypothetical protein
MRHVSSTRFRCCRATLAAALLIAAAPATSAQAAPATDAACTSVFTAYVTPGFDAHPSAGSGTTRGETGALLCTGTVDGHRITGPGTMGFDETYRDAACLSDASSGHFSATLPTTSGPMQLGGDLEAHRVGFVEFVEITFPRAHFSGLGPIVPTKGDCVIRRITEALVSITGTLRG